ncbi:MAG: DegT/DnrJ/EryC1/StrS family aminotransferase, partial [Endomicrobiia bacterium]|nr:DegT/DnrJ/EryC1/StrS family aminotransferase [Endomicrobiia bacterium]
MKVPMLDLSPQYEPIRSEVFKAIEKVYDSKKFILGPEVEAFEGNVARYIGAKHAVGVSSGTDALLISLMAAGIGAGDEVVTTDFSFFATAGVIARTGAKPVFADIDPLTYNMDPRDFAAKITPRTKAVIVVHLYGQSAEMDAIMSAARAKGIVVIEDAAQSLGAQYNDGRRAGSIGDFGCFSFFPSKNLGAMGDAGLVTVNDDALAQNLRLLRGHGAVRKYYHSMIGGNFRIDTLQAAILDVKLKYLDGWTAARQKNAEYYVELFNDAGLVSSGDV